MSVDVLDPPASALSEREHDRRRAHLLGEIERTARLRGRLRPLALVVPLAAVAAVLAAVLPGALERSRVTLVSQALAAIGDQPTIHVVFDYGPQTPIVDLRTGKTHKADVRLELWFDPRLGTLWRRTIDGRLAEQVTWKGHGGPEGPGGGTWQAFVRGYRAELRNGSYHEIGRGAVAGQPVEWVAGSPITTVGGKTYVEEVAISLATYKPLAFRWRTGGRIEPGAGARVLVAETLPLNPKLYSGRRIVGEASTAGRNGGTGSRTTLKAARAAMSPGPIVPPARLAGLGRTWIGEPQLLIEPATSYRDQVPGVTFYYGRLDQWRVPGYTGSFVAITEVSDPHFADALWGPGLIRPGKAVLGGSVVGGASATLKVHGVWVLVEASSRARALAAARAVARAD